MATQEDVRRIALGLRGVMESDEGFGFLIESKGKLKSLLHLWRERIDPKKTKVVNEGVLVVTVKNLEVKEMLVASGGDRIFTEPHYNGYPAVLVRLAAIETDELENLIVESWRTKAPLEWQREYDETHSGPI